MALSQQKFREIVFQLVYSADLSSAGDEEMLPFMMRQFAISRSGIRQAQAMKSQVVEKMASLDEWITNTSEEYRLERIPGIERAILRLALYEILYTSLPPKVAITEAMRLTRKFASPEAATFVNAILDKVYKHAAASQA